MIGQGRGIQSSIQVLQTTLKHNLLRHNCNLLALKHIVENYDGFFMGGTLRSLETRDSSNKGQLVCTANRALSAVKE